MSLRWKLLLPLLLASLAILAYLALAWVPNYLETQRQEYYQEVDHHLDSVIEGLIPLMLSSQLDLIHENLDQLKEKNRDWRAILLVDDRGRRLYPPLTDASVAAGADHSQWLTLDKDIGYLGQPIGHLTVRLDLAGWLERRHQQHARLLLMLAGSIAVLALVWAVMVEGVVMRPLRRLSGAARAMAERRFDVPLPDGRRDEVGRLIDSFSAMRRDLKAYQDELLSEIGERRHAEEELRRYKDHLEETVQQRTSELLLARDAAEAANKAKSLFLANMSHELRTPLNAILGFSSMMRREPELADAQRESLDIINRSGEHLLTLINDVLDMAKIEAGRMQLEVAPFDLGGMVRDVAEMMEIRAREKGLRLMLDLSSAFPRFIRGDEARLRQILINLVGNAVKFTTAGGVAIRLGVRREDRLHLLIEVEDSGPGIGPEDQQRLFEPFVQLTEDAARRGTGLGLTITRQFVQMMGGHIVVASEVGKGSVFRVDLPVEPAEADDIAQASPDGRRGDVAGLAPGQPAYRILIAEDQYENQLLLARLMEGLGIETRVAENGAACVDEFQAWHPDLIWMDRRMPVMDGLEATRRIRLLPGGKAVKIVAVTASVFKEQQQELLDAGLDDFIRKPYRFDEIYDCLARQLGVEYTYRDTAFPAPRSPATLPAPERLAALPAALRDELRSAAEALDCDRVNSVLEQVGAADAELAATLSRLAADFDFPAILKALTAANEGTGAVAA